MKALTEVAFLIAVIGIGNIFTCPDGYGCYRYPEKCEPDMCDMTVTWMADDAGRIFFSIRAKNNGTKPRWAAIGFSSDKTMGEDDILMCRQTQILTLVLEHYWSLSDPRSIHRDSSADPSNDGLYNIATLSQDGFFSCNFSRALKVEGKDHIFDLSPTSATPNYYMLFGRGPVKSNLPRQHEVNPDRSSARVDYTEAGEVTDTDSADKDEDNDDDDDDDDENDALDAVGRTMVSMMTLLLMTCLAMLVY